MRCSCSSLLLAIALAVGVQLAASQAPPYLKDYVNKPDPNYAYFDTGIRLNGLGWTGYLLNLTSQAWLTPADTDHPIWTHQLVVIVPTTITFNGTAAMYITGGGNGDGTPDILSEDILLPAILATSTGTIAATLFQVPNQPIVFTADPSHSKRSEDSLVAFSWGQFLNDTSRPEWVSLLPMVKSAVKAMDAIQDYVSKTQSLNIESFVVAGASKRGWTTWLTGAVDSRVIGIAPIVMDMLNFEQNVLHMFQAYGGWTFAFVDYWNQNITGSLGYPSGEALAAIIDPLNYVESLTMPKLVIDGVGDEFFMPDDDWYWWGKLKGETMRLMIPNAEHSMATGVFDLVPSVIAWYMALLTNTPRPVINWSIDFQGSGQITLTTTSQPSKVVLYFATTFDDVRRDFRLIKGNTTADPCKFIPVKVFGNACVNPVLWIGEDIAPTSVANGTYTYIANQPLPDSGWRGFLLELFFPGPRGTEFRFTSQVSIIPNTFPFAPCFGTPEGCKGVLV